MFSGDLEKTFFDLDEIGLRNRPLQFAPVAAIGSPGAPRNIQFRDGGRPVRRRRRMAEPVPEADGPWIGRPLATIRGCAADFRSRALHVRLQVPRRMPTRCSAVRRWHTPVSCRSTCRRHCGSRASWRCSRARIISPPAAFRSSISLIRPMRSTTTRRAFRDLPGGDLHRHSPAAAPHRPVALCRRALCHGGGKVAGRSPGRRRPGGHRTRGTALSD